MFFLIDESLSITCKARVYQIPRRKHDWNNGDSAEQRMAERGAVHGGGIVAEYKSCYLISKKHEFQPWLSCSRRANIARVPCSPHYAARNFIFIIVIVFLFLFRAPAYLYSMRRDRSRPRYIYKVRRWGIKANFCLDFRVIERTFPSPRIRSHDRNVRRVFRMKIDVACTSILNALKTCKKVW